MGEEVSMGGRGAPAQPKTQGLHGTNPGRGLARRLLLAAAIAVWFGICIGVPPGWWMR